MRRAMIAVALMCCTLACIDELESQQDPVTPDATMADGDTPDTRAPDTAMPDALSIPDAAPPPPLPPCGHPESQCVVDADCGSNRCAEVLPGSEWCLCVGPRPPNPVQCAEDESEDECCRDAECPADQYCLGDGYNDRREYCWGPEDYGGRCVDDVACAGHDDCPADHVCVPAGLFGYWRNHCVPTRCTLDAQCADGPDGRCSFLAIECEEPTFACTYADDVCRSDDDCEAWAHCVPGPDGRTLCREYEPPP